MGRFLALALCIALSGCSLFMKRVPLGWDESADPGCTKSSAPPKVDVAIGVPITLLGAYFIYYGLRVCDGGDTDSCGVGAVLGVPLVLIGVPSSLASIRGFRNASRCKRAYRVHNEWVRQREESGTRP